MWKIQFACKEKDKCQNVRHATQKGNRGEVSLWAVGRVVHTRIECWVLGEHESKKVEGDDVGNEFQEGLPEERPA